MQTGAGLRVAGLGGFRVSGWLQVWRKPGVWSKEISGG